MTLTRRELAELAGELDAFFDAEAAALYRPRYNIAPTDLHFVLRARPDGRHLEPLHWGMPGTGKRKGPLINARSESARFAEAFRGAFQGGRCVVPADGFFEWKTVGEGGGQGRGNKGRGTRQPIWFHRPDGRLLLLAGLCEGDAFTVLTTAPNALIGQIHDRMPAILSPEEASAWLAAPSQKLLHPAPEGVLEGRPVSTRVNSVRNDDPACLDPPGPEPQQLSLV
jgi:putative SOS response-associated peptidase YedK